MLDPIDLPRLPAFAPYWPRRSSGLAPIAAIALASLAGCAGAPPSAPPDLSTTSDAAFASSPATGREFDAGWWKTFGDPTLESLVERGRDANHDVRIAAERIREARAGSTAAASRLFPTVSLTGNAADQRSGLPEIVKRTNPDVRAYQAAVQADWQLDLFGAARASSDAAALDAEAAAVGVEAARLAASAEIAREYALWQGARLRVERLRQMLRTRRDAERLTRSREAAGQASRFDVARSAGETEALAAQLPPLETLVATLEKQIAVLLGESPNRPLALLRDAPAASLPAVPELATGQPSELLERRPDLRIAVRRYEAEGARLRGAVADQWPSFFLSALFGREDLRLNGFDFAPVRYSSVALAFSAPLFDAGRLRAAVERQSARERQATLEYEKAVLSAVQDVESSLVSLQGERQRLAALDAATRETRIGLGHAQSLYREGQIDLLQLLDAERALLAAELSATDSRTQLVVDAIQLFKAMGGGWRTTPPAEPLALEITASGAQR